MIEACIDIANYIISSERFRRAENYADMFKVLGENKIISENLAGKMALIARFRNFLVHRYEKLDTEKIVEIVREHLVDIEMFMEEIRRKYLTA